MEPRPKPTPARVADWIIGKSCPICLNRLDLRFAAVIVPCMHAYCHGCIRRWSNLKRKCPLCNANFSSFFCKKDGFFREEKLLPFGRERKTSLLPPDVLLQRRRAQFFERRRLIRRSREVLCLQSQSRELPRQRSFLHATHESPDTRDERIRQWRASIYEKGLQAVPSRSRNTLMQQIRGNDGVKEMVRRRIEPWIHRELQAILGDPNPTIIVHVVTSLFISKHEKNLEKFSVQIGLDDDLLVFLRPFLQDKTVAFWHELACFAESSYSMETYDTVVEYREVE